MASSKRLVIVFARAPAPGRCKTRLIPVLGASGSARLHRRMGLRTIATALESGAAVQLWCTPDTRHPFFLACRRDFGVRLRRQPGGDLGRRMALALARVLTEGANTVVLAGTDCPSLSSQDFNNAFAALAKGGGVLLQPSTDGGYVLIGARRMPRRALAGIAWSSGHELAQTRRRFTRLGLRSKELPQRADVDTPADYRRARRAGLI